MCRKREFSDGGRLRLGIPDLTLPVRCCADGLPIKAAWQEMLVFEITIELLIGRTQNESVQCFDTSTQLNGMTNNMAPHKHSC